MKSFRTKICLNGTWSFVPVAEFSEEQLNILPDEQMHSIRVPSIWDAPYEFGFPKEWKELSAGWYTRSMPPIEDIGNKRIFLCCKGIGHIAHVFINGCSAGTHVGHHTPFEIELTGMLSGNGGEMLQIGVENRESSRLKNGKFVYPTGSGHAKEAGECGIWDDIFLETRPGVHISDIFVSTSVRKKELTAMAEISNTTSENVDCAIEYVISKWGKDDCIKKIFQKSLCVSAGEKITVETSAAWENAELWSPENPILYTLDCRLIASGKNIDLFSRRFGFREFWIEGKIFFLNGTRINLRGDSWHYQGVCMQSREYAKLWYKMCKETGINIIRLHAQPYPAIFQEVADEDGMLLVGESDIHGSPGNLAVEEDVFWENCARHLSERVLRDRNHPSVVIWSAENELDCCRNFPYREKILEFEKIIKRLDPTRPVYFEDNQLLNNYPVIRGFHYPFERPVDTAYPDVVSDKLNNPSSHWYWDRSKPLYIGESMLFFYACCDETSVLGGEKTYESYPNHLESAGVMARMQVEILRYNEVSAITVWNTVWYCLTPLPFKTDFFWKTLEGEGIKPEKIRPYACTLNPGYDKNLPEYEPNPAYKHIKKAFSPEAVFIREYNINFYAGDTVQREFTIYNDTMKVRNYKFAWKFSSFSGGIATGQECLSIKPGEKHDGFISASLPVVDKKEAFDLHLELSSNNKIVFSDSKNYFVHPRKENESSPYAANRKIGIFDPCGDTLQMLDEYAIPYVEVEHLPEFPYLGLDVLIIGNNAFTDDGYHLYNMMLPISHCDTKLKEFVKNGGTLLLLAQQHIPEWFPFTFALGKVTPITMAFRSCFESPMTSGLEDKDLRFWNEDNAVAFKGFQKPSKGNFKIFAEAGGPTGLDLALLFEIQYGKGSCIFNQFLLNKRHSEPAANLLARNILSYAISNSQRCLSQLHLFQADKSLVEKMTELHVGHEEVGFDFFESSNGQNIVLASATMLDKKVNVPVLQNFVAHGGILWLHDSTPMQADILSRLIGAKIDIESFNAIHAVKACENNLLDSVSNHDTFWVGKSAKGWSLCVEDKTELFQHSMNIIIDDKNNNCQVLLKTGPAAWENGYIYTETMIAQRFGFIDARQQPKFTTVLAKIDYGKGCFILDQVLWNKKSSKTIESKINRFLLAMMTNLKIKVTSEFHGAGMSNIAVQGVEFF